MTDIHEDANTGNANVIVLPFGTRRGASHGEIPKSLSFALLLSHMKFSNEGL